MSAFFRQSDDKIKSQIKMKHSDFFLSIKLTTEENRRKQHLVIKEFILFAVVSVRFHLLSGYLLSHLTNSSIYCKLVFEILFLVSFARVTWIHVKNLAST